MAALSAVGVPLRLLHEAEGHPVTVELKSGDLYRGHLLAAEDSMNVQLNAVVHTARDGRVTKCVGRDRRGRAALAAACGRARSQ